MKKSLAALCALLISGCASVPEPEAVTAWQAEELRLAGADEAVDSSQPLAAALSAVDLRRVANLKRARQDCLRLVLDHPDSPAVLWRASRAEADRVVLARSKGEPREVRDLAALSGLDYARRAAERAPEDPAARAQLAYALGTTTHLLPMGARSERARDVLQAVDAALALDPEQPVALATQATLHLRLATLPWIATVFASDVPEADLALAERAARHALRLQDSHEHRLLLAKVLLARDAEDEARSVLNVAGAGAPQPRDEELRAEVEALRAELD
ncbi:MAG: hypothetical protein KDD82_12100 [Planctomycetes bacterium]|nr:hypothetical protein [Planctomycetota bacterium]